MDYLHWNEQTITDFSENNISDKYNHGYVFTRIGKGVMHQTRSVRIDLSKFKLSSENKRILKKIPGITGHLSPLPLENYKWSLGKIAKDFYETKFGPGIMSAAKIKEILTDADKSNFNTLITYSNGVEGEGYVIAYKNDSILHYSYPFYNTEIALRDLGLGMMITAIQYAQEIDLKYIYLGSLQRPGDTYKLQFEGLEWFDGEKWNSNTDEVKKILSEEKK